MLASFHNVTWHKQQTNNKQTNNQTNNKQTTNKHEQVMFGEDDFDALSSGGAGGSFLEEKRDHRSKPSSHRSRSRSRSHSPSKHKHHPHHINKSATAITGEMAYQRRVQMSFNHDIGRRSHRDGHHESHQTQSRPPRGSDLDEPMPELHSIHRGVVKSVQPFGAFVQLRGKRRQGLVHISQ